MCNDVLDLNGVCSTILSLGGFYLCGRKIVDLQFKSADGRLAEDEGFVAALHLNHRDKKVLMTVYKILYFHSC